HGSGAGVARSCPSSDIGVEGVFLGVVKHPGVTPRLVRPDFEVERLVPSWIRLDDRGFVVPGPHHEIVGGGETDALYPTAFGAAGTGVKQVPTPLVIDDAAGPGRVVVP